MTHADDSPDRDERPLQGLRIVVTRPPGQADSFARRLRALGGEPVPCPTIRIAPPEDAGPLRRAARDAGRYSWVVFTSVNGVDRLGEALEREERAEGALDGARLAAIGPATADRARGRFGREAIVVPGEYRAEALAGAICRRAAEASSGDGGREDGGELEGERVLLPRAAEARPVLPERLEAAGAAVDEVAAYRALPVDGAELDPVREQLEAGDLDWLTFTASSTVRNFVSALGSDPGRARVAAIGPVTAGTAREHGLRVDAVAEEYTIPGLVDALVRASGGGEREAA